MKIKQQQYDVMFQAMKAFADAAGIGFLKQQCQTLGINKLIWTMWNAVGFDLMTDDTHPVYKTKHRFVPYNPSFQMYADGVNDDHIATALKKIIKELGIV